MSDNIELERLFEQGVAALRSGDKATARDLLTQVIEKNQLHEQAWLWLSAAVEENEERIICLQNVLTINPDNQAARKGLAELGTPPENPPPPARSASPPTPSPARNDESWRQAIYEEKEKPPPRSATASPAPARFDADVRPAFADNEGISLPLSYQFRMWLSTTIFRLDAYYDLQIELADFRHTIANLIAIACLKILIGLVAVLLVFLLTGGSGFASVIEPAAVFLEEVGRVDAEAFVPIPFREAVRAINIIWGIEIPRPFDATFRQLEASGQALRDLAAGVWGSLFLVFIGFILAIFLSTFLIEMLRATVVNGLARFMGGKGDVIQTFYALTTTRVSGLIALLPIALLIVFSPPQMVMTLVAILAVYRLVVDMIALGKTHKLGIFSLLWVLFFSSALLNTAGLVLLPFVVRLPGG